METPTPLVFKWYSSYSAFIFFPDITFEDPQDTKSTEKNHFQSIYLSVVTIVVMVSVNGKQVTVIHQHGGSIDYNNAYHEF